MIVHNFKSAVNTRRPLVRLCFACGLLFFFMVSGMGQTEKLPLKFEQFSLAEGLSQSSVICMLQDRQGFLWVGTQDGLNRFDGYQLTFYLQ